MAYEYENIRVEQVEDRILTMSFIRPDKLNSWTMGVIDDMCDFFARLRTDHGNSVVIIRGEGEKGLSAGIDVMKVFVPTGGIVTSMYDIQTKLGELVINIRKCPQVVIIEAFGHTVGGGMILAMASDIRIITDDVKLGLPFIKIGMGGADLGSSYFLARQIGAGVAYDLILTGRNMEADEAMRLGFASQRVATKAEADEAAMARAREIAQLDANNVAMTKEALNAGLDMGGLEAAIMMEHRNQLTIGAHEKDKREAAARAAKAAE